MKHFIFHIALFFLCLGGIHERCWGKDLGTYGPVFAIAEENLLEVIQRKLLHLQKTGKIDNINKDIQQRVKQSAQEPKAAHHLPCASKYQSRLFDPSITMPDDITDPDWKVLIKGGTKVNPLDYVQWRDPLLFINGHDEDQVNWAGHQGGKIVLIDGKPFEIHKKLQRWIYFDQGGIAVKRFKIKALPSRITQKDKSLLIEEIDVKERLKPLKTSKEKIT